MKVEGPSGIRYTGPVTRAKKASATDKSSFSDHLTDDTASTNAATSASPVMSVDQLLGLQEVNDALTGRKQAMAHANDILDKLDLLRLQILEGRISKEQLMQLARSITTRKALTTDPRLLAVLDEIDLRAQVEIAKFTRDIASSGAAGGPHQG
ncbi:MAG: flagellar assembly protein FliX [Bdellovibrionales bacterium]